MLNNKSWHVDSSILLLCVSDCVWMVGRQTERYTEYDQPVSHPLIHLLLRRRRGDAKTNRDFSFASVIKDPLLLLWTTHLFCGNC